MKKLLLLLFLVISAVTVPAGTVDTIKVHSAKMNRDISVTVTYPTRTKANKNKKYPVVYLLHGAYANEYKWLELKPSLPKLADEKEMIFVTPYVLNSWYFDSPVNKDFQYETFCIDELIPYIDANYPTIANREHRAVTGLSMGGHGAFFLGIRHKDLFGAIGSMSGGVDIRPFPQNWNIPDMLGEMAANKQSWDEHTAMELVKQLKNHDVEITFDCGESDFFLEVNKALHARLLALGIDHDFTTRPGGHTDQYWANSLDYHLLFFKKYFEGEMKR
jgi:S-formylglutathione hydrolase FrmB